MIQGDLPARKGRHCEERVLKIQRLTQKRGKRSQSSRISTRETGRDSAKSYGINGVFITAGKLEGSRKTLEQLITIGAVLKKTATD